MTSRARELLREVLALPSEERADVAAELIASLDDAEPHDSADVEAAWAAEIEKRARRVGKPTVNADSSRNGIRGWDGGWRMTDCGND